FRTDPVGKPSAGMRMERFSPLGSAADLRPDGGREEDPLDGEFSIGKLVKLRRGLDAAREREAAGAGGGKHGSGADALLAADDDGRRVIPEKLFDQVAFVLGIAIPLIENGCEEAERAILPKAQV